MNLKDQILQSTGRTIKKLTIPQWKLEVCIRSLSVTEMTECQALVDNHSLQVVPRICIMGLCDELGNLLFDLEALPALLEKDFAALQLIAEAIMALSAKDPSAAKKN